MKKMFVASLVLAAALAAGCSKKKANTTPSNTDTKTETKTDGEAKTPPDGEKTPDGAAADPCAAPN